MPGVRRDWLDEMAALTLGGPDWPADAVAAATKDAARLAALARALVDGGVLPASCGYPDGCALARALPHACDLARALAKSPGARALPPTIAGDPKAATDAFVSAVADAGSAIYVCRRVLHPTGECLFGSGAPTEGNARNDTDLCARLLLAAHRLGGTDHR
jgi:hypothetical protein